MATGHILRGTMPHACTPGGLPISKLRCSLARPVGPGHNADTQAQPAVVLLSCGSFNPPTIMHLRMFELAAYALRQVLYAYSSMMHGILSLYIIPFIQT